MLPHRAQSLLAHLPGDLYRALFEQSPLGMFVFDSNLVIIDSNPRLERILGLPREKVLGFELTRATDRSLLGSLRKALGGETTQYQGPYRSTVSGRTVEVRIAFNPLRD